MKYRLLYLNESKTKKFNVLKLGKSVNFFSHEPKFGSGGMRLVNLLSWELCHLKKNSCVCVEVER